MKTIIAFVFIATFTKFQVCHGSIDKAEIDQTIEHCLKINKLTSTFLDEVFTYNLDSKTDENYIKLTKFLTCTFRTIGIFEGPNDDINEEKLKEYFAIGRSEHKAKEMVKECNKKESTPEETAMGLFVCELTAGIV